MSKRVTTTTLPQRVCPVCGDQVVKVVRMGQLSYECSKHWGPWDDAKKVNAGCLRDGRPCAPDGAGGCVACTDGRGSMGSPDREDYEPTHRV